ncbi:minor capsid protein [Ruminococcus flavefaciens]|uniref:Minor capsid protein n=1 Tax=Ruminococcus flavefaciens TaxID=1265 RepID=A0A315YQZ5_RUMFL|nr:minor capsid protein [Ruminococcus flavefaciens]PWJ14608.1 minor capsid protein [Ruminococcus flavefaciens]SSA42638.1 Minor capsid protein [Ruminococcus flavefaciens]
MINFVGLKLNANFDVERKKYFAEAQKTIDSEVLRLSDPYVPFRTGMMKKSGISGTKIGSGVIEYTAPYAKEQYYVNRGLGKEGMNRKKGTKGLRGPFFFERMKADHKEEILKRVSRKI